MDLSGQQPRSAGGAEYLMMIVDDYSRMGWPYFLNGILTSRWPSLVFWRTLTPEVPCPSSSAFARTTARNLLSRSSWRHSTTVGFTASTRRSTPRSTTVWLSLNEGNHICRVFPNRKHERANAYWFVLCMVQCCVQFEGDHNCCTYVGTPLCRKQRPVYR